MKKSELKQLVLEAMAGGYESKDGKLVPHYDKFDSTKLSNILRKIATQGEVEGKPQDQPEIKEDADKIRAQHLGTLRGSLMHIIALLNAERPHEEIIAYVKKALEQVGSSDTVSSRGRMAEGEGEQTYLVYYRVGEDDDDDVEVKASSPEEAIKKVKSGQVKTAGGQNIPRLARSFSAKLLNK